MLIIKLRSKPPPTDARDVKDSFCSSLESVNGIEIRYLTQKGGGRSQHRGSKI